MEGEEEAARARRAVVGPLELAGPATEEYQSLAEAARYTLVAKEKDAVPPGSSGILCTPLSCRLNFHGPYLGAPKLLLRAASPRDLRSEAGCFVRTHRDSALAIALRFRAGLD
jgi:hypothetical protein